MPLSGPNATKIDIVEQMYDACPKYSELGNIRIKAYLYVRDGSHRWQRQYSKKNYSVFIYSKAEPHAMYAIYKQTLTLCVLQYYPFISFQVVQVY